MVKLTSLTGKALFYKGAHSLKHKILALEEEAGAEQAGLRHPQPDLRRGADHRDHGQGPGHAAG